MRIMLQDYDDNPIIYSVEQCTIDHNPDTFYFKSKDMFYKLVFDEGYINLKNIMDSILQDGYYSFYRLFGYKCYYFSDVLKAWIDTKEGN